MKLKVVIVDLEIPPHVKKWGLRIGIPAALLLGGGAVAYAAALVTWSDGQTLTAADLNTNFSNLQTQITALQGQAHPASAFHAWMTTPPANPIPITTVVKQLVFDHVEYDLAQEYNPATGAFVPKQSGYYLVTCALAFNPGSASTAQYSAIVFRNGTEESTSALFESGFVIPQTVNHLQLSSGDSITCGAYQNSGTSQPLDLAIPQDFTSFAVARLY